MAIAGKRGRPKKRANFRPSSRSRGRPPARFDIVWNLVGEYLRLRLDCPSAPTSELCRRLAMQHGYEDHQLESGAEYIRQQLRFYSNNSATGPLKELEADWAQRRKQPPQELAPLP